nr:hypothetical protein [Tanacetum cinerariifolium]
MGRADPHYTSSCAPSLGDVAMVRTAGTIPRLHQYNPNGPVHLKKAVVPVFERVQGLSIADVSDSDPLSFADPQSRHPADVAQSSQDTAAAGDPESENASFASAVGSPESIYRPEWGVANGNMLDTPEACQHLYNMNLARQVAMGSQLRLMFEQEAKLLRKSVARVARRDKRIQAREHKIKNLEALLEAEADMKKAAEDKSARLSQELEDMRTLFLDLQRCAKMDARLDALSIDFDEELYPHMLTAIAGIERSEVSFSGSIGGPERRPYGCDYGCPVRDPMSPWTCKEEMLLVDAIAANISCAEKKKKCRIVCRTYGVGSAHHARSDGVPVSAPTIVPQGLALLLADAATQTDTD